MVQVCCSKGVANLNILLSELTRCFLCIMFVSSLLLSVRYFLPPLPVCFSEGTYEGGRPALPVRPEEASS